MTTAYVPLASSLAARAVAHLQTLDPGAVLATAPLAEALGVDSATFAAGVSVAVRYGLLKQQVRERRSYWSLGDGVSLPVPDDDEPLVQRVVEANSASLPDVPRWPGLDVDAAPITLGRPKRSPKPCAKTAHPTPTTPPPRRSLALQAAHRRHPLRALVGRPAAGAARRRGGDPVLGRGDAPPGALPRADGGER